MNEPFPRRSLIKLGSDVHVPALSTSRWPSQACSSSSASRMTLRIPHITPCSLLRPLVKPHASSRPYLEYEIHRHTDFYATVDVRSFDPLLKRNHRIESDMSRFFIYLIRSPCREMEMLQALDLQHVI